MNELSAIRRPALETEDAFLVAYDERVTLLQKSDLTTGDVDGLRKLVSEQIPLSSLLA